MTSQTNRAKLPIALKDPFLHGCTVEDCGMHGTSYPVRPRGSWDARAAWLGEAAGMQEEKENCTFVGPAGELTEEVLSEIGVSFDKNFIVPNICLCRPHPPKGSKKQNRTPTAKEVKSCRPHLEKIMSLHDPHLVVLVGGQAAKAVLNDPGTISGMVGRFFGPDEHNLPISADAYAIWHPAYILRNMSQKKEWMRQLTRMRDYMIGMELLVP